MELFHQHTQWYLTFKVFTHEEIQIKSKHWSFIIEPLNWLPFLGLYRLNLEPKKFFEEESKSVGYKSEKVIKFIKYYSEFQDMRFLNNCWSEDFLDDHQIGVMYESLKLEIYRRLILDEDKDWVRYMVETYFSSPNTIEYLESKMMMRGV